MISNEKLGTAFQQYTTVAKSYYFLSIKKCLNDQEADMLADFLEKAANDSVLEFLLNEIDHMVAHKLKLIDSDYIEKQQQKLRETFMDKEFVLQNLPKQYSKKVQHQLKRQGLYGGNIDGFYGVETKQSLKIATKKVQKYLKQERIYNGGIDGHCNLALIQAINKYKESLNKKNLRNKDNAILELATVVCTKIPSFLDSNHPNYATVDNPEESLVLDDKINNTDSKMKLSNFMSPKFGYLRKGFYCFGIVATLISINYLPKSFTEWNTANTNNRREFASKAKHSAYLDMPKFQSNVESFKQDIEKSSINLLINTTHKFPSTKTDKKYFFPANTLNYIQDQILKYQVSRIWEIAYKNAKEGQNLYSLKDQDYKLETAKNVAVKAKENLGIARNIADKISLLPAYRQSDYDLISLREKISEAMQFSYQSLQFSTQEQQIVAETNTDKELQIKMLKQSQIFLSKANQWQLIGENIKSGKKSWDRKIHASLDI